MGGILGRRALDGLQFSEDDIPTGNSINSDVSYQKDLSDSFLNPLKRKRPHIVEQRRHYGDSSFKYPVALDPTKEYRGMITSPFTFTNSKFEDVLDNADWVSPMKELKESRQDLADGRRKVKYYLTHPEIDARRVEPNNGGQFQEKTRATKIIATYNPANRQVDFNTAYPHVKRRR